jgi:hypothetical protein
LVVVVASVEGEAFDGDEVDDATSEDVEVSGSEPATLSTLNTGWLV